jgi:serine/threonine protein kinase/WD40 repeat protein
MDSTDDLLAALLARPDDQWRRGLEDVCLAHPERAAELRRRFAHLERCGVAAPVEGTTADALPERFGPYRLLRRIGDGGMGSVWLALHETLGRDVALKMIRPERLWFPNARERFQREVEAIARLRHPGCVQVHQVGEAAGVPYFAMEYVAGANCEQLVAALRACGVPLSRLSGANLAGVLRHGGAVVESSTSELFGEPWVRVAVRIVLAATEAIAHAHARGIVHRDLKPSNLMVTPDGRVVVIDFGLADAEGASALTREGSMLGSVPYMAPEQLRGLQAAIGVRTDVRGLGVCLHELLALRPPFAANDEQRLRADILAGTATPLREQNPLVGRDLAVVVERAMHVDPEQRYPSALDLAADLMAVLEDRPVQARRDAMSARLRRQMRRRPAVATAIALVLIGLLVVPTAISFAVAAQRNRAQAAELQARQREYVANVAAAAAALQAGKGEEARLRLDACAPELRRFEWHHLALALDASFAVIQVTPHAVTAVAVTSAGDRVAAGTSTGAIVMFDLADGRSVREFVGGGTAAIESVGFDRTGASLFSIDADRHLRAYDVATGRLVRQRPRAAAHEHLGLADPVDQIVVARGGARIARIDPTTFEQGADQALELHDWPTDNRFLVRGDELWAGFSSGLCVWNTTNGRCTAEHVHAERVAVLGVSGDHGTVAAMDGQGLVLWTRGESTATTVGLGGRRPVSALFPRLGRFVVVPCSDGQIVVRDPETRTWRTLCGHRGAITSAAEVPRTSTFVTGGVDGTVRLWSTTAVPNLVDLAGGGWGRGLAVDAGGRLYTGAEDAIAAAVDAETGAVAWQARHWHWVNALAVVADAQTLVTSVHSTLRFWSTIDGADHGELALPTASSLAMRMVPARSGDTIAIADRLGNLTLVDTGARIVTFHGRVHQDAIVDLAFTATGQVLTASLDGGIARTQPGDHSPPEALAPATAPCRALALAPGR